MSSGSLVSLNCVTWCWHQPRKATNDLHSLKPHTDFCSSVYSLSHLQKGQWELISDRADPLLAGAMDIPQDTACSGTELFGGTDPSLSHVASSWAVLWAGEMQKITTFLPSWFLPKIWCLHVRPPSKWQHTDLEEILCQLQIWFTNCTKSMVIHRKVRATMDIHKTYDAVFHRGEMHSSLPLQANHSIHTWLYLEFLTHCCL